MYRNRRPPNDDAYFENMSRVIFSRRISSKTVDKKWDDLKKAFNNFSIDDVSTFNKERYSTIDKVIYGWRVTD